MNKQTHDSNNIHAGIRWTDYTWNPIAGCEHGCRWQMPDGTVAICYAESMVNRMRSQGNGVNANFYAQGFAHNYFHPERLTEPSGVKRPSKIFQGSMADIFGINVLDEHIALVLKACVDNPHHTFQFLTKNIGRLMSRKSYWRNDIPPNVWLGISTPPDFMYNSNKPLTDDVRQRMFKRNLEVLLSSIATVKWVSAEPLTLDISDALKVYPIDWIVIGAASNGNTYYQPNVEWVQAALDVLDAQQVPVFFKGNIYPTIAETLKMAWREEFPDAPLAQISI